MFYKFVDDNWDNGVYLHPFLTAHTAPDLSNQYGRTLIGEVVFRFHYRKQHILVDTLARLVALSIKELSWGQAVDILVITPGPYGNNHQGSNLLAQWITHLTSIPHGVETLQKTGVINEFMPRSSYANGEFKISNPKIIENQRVLLLDQVVGSGDNLRKASAALKQAGAKGVYVLGLVRTMTDSEALAA